MAVLNPCLWFRQSALEAAEFYASVLDETHVGRVMRGNGTVIAVELDLAGRALLLLNGRPSDGFTDASSLMLTCRTQDEVDRTWAALTDGGEEGRCGWCTDRFGVSWQVVPAGFMELLNDADPARAARAMQAMMGMRKLDIDALRRARDGDAAGA